MADSSVAVTPGQGTNVDGYTLDNSNFRQSVVLGDAALNANTAAIGADGTLAVNCEGRKASYSSLSSNFAVAASATDIFTISGSATKTVRVTKFGISGIQTTPGVATIVVVKRSSANSGGTTVTPTIAPHDSNNAAATAVVTEYTANPASLGTLVSNVRLDRVLLSAAASDRLVYEFGNHAQEIVLRGTAQLLGFNLAGVTYTGGNVSCFVEWTEE